MSGRRNRFGNARRVVVAAVAAASVLTTSAQAATFTVTKGADTLDGTCNSDCSLREAVQAANVDATKDEIVLPAGQFVLSRLGATEDSSEDANASGDVDIQRDVTIRGAGARRTTIRQALRSHYEDRILDVLGPGVDLDLSDVTIADGYSVASYGLGGGINASGGGDLKLTRVVLRENRAEGSASYADGGGVAFSDGDLTIRDSAFIANRATSGAYGSALYLAGAGANVVLENVTFTQNVVSNSGTGGTIHASNPIQGAFTNITVVGNESEQAPLGAGLVGDFTNVRVRSSILAGNVGPAGVPSNCRAGDKVVSDGGNVGDAACGLTAATDVSGSPMLAELSADAIPVLEPLAGSPALDHAVGVCSAADARGLARPQGSACDSGAAERFVPAIPPGVFPPPPPEVVPAADVTAPALVLPTRLAVDSGRKNVKVPITCPAAESSCSGSLTITIAGPKRNGQPTTVTVASGAFPTTAAGQTTTAKLKLTKSGRKLLAGRSTRKATLTVTVTDAAGNRATPVAKVSLAVDKPKKKRSLGMPFTLTNLRTDPADVGSNFSGPAGLEFRHANAALGLEQSGLSFQRIPPNYRFPIGHTHKTQEEVFVVVGGSGRMKLDDEIVDVKLWDALRVPPGTWRGYEAGPDGLEILVIGAPSLGEQTREDVEGRRGWWTD